MRNIRTLFLLQSRIIINQLKKRNLIRPLYAVIFLTIIMLAIFLFGYSLGELIISSNKTIIEPDIKGILLYSLNILTFALIIAKIFSQNRIYKEITYKNLRYLPINLLGVFGIDFIFSLFNKTSFLLGGLLIGLLSGMYSFDVSFFSLIILVFTLIIFVHLMIVLIDSIIRLINYRFNQVYFVLAIIVLTFYLIYSLSNDKMELMLLNTPIGWSIKTIIFLPAIKDITVITNAIIYNLISILIGTICYVFIKWKDINNLSKNKKHKHHQLNNNLLITIINKLGKSYNGLIEKDIKYILRSSRGGLIMFGDIIFLFIYISNYYLNFFKIPNDILIYFTLYFSIFFPIFLSDNYLSNQWGMEREAFCFYLYAPINSNNNILAKNLSYFIIKIPALIIIPIVLGYVISLKLIPIAIFMQIIINLSIIIPGNLNSIKAPSPIDLTENALSRRKTKGKSSAIGFFILLFTFLFSFILLFILWEFNFELYSYLIFLLITIMIIIIYFISLNPLSKLFNYQKGKIYKRLLND